MKKLSVLFSILFLPLLLAPSMADAGHRHQRGDTDGDGMLSRAEFQHLGTKRFERLDRDDNGLVKASEFTALHCPKAKKRVSKRHSLRQSWREQRFAAIDTNADGQLDATEFQSGHSTRFDNADTDQDGLLSKSERKQLRSTKRQQYRQYVFVRADADGNGYLTAAELREHMAQHKNKNREGHRSARFQKRFDKAFAKADRDADGSLSSAEFNDWRPFQRRSAKLRHQHHPPH